MRRFFELRSTPTDVVLRAVAIASVVHNHSVFEDLGGGTAFLVMLSGMNFARFAIKDGTESGIPRAIAGIARQIFFPSLVLILLSFAAYQKFDLLELLFIRPHHPQKISAFPVWFSHMMIQLLAAFYLLFSIPAVARATLRHPARAMLLLFSVGVFLRSIAGYGLFDSLLRMPWNFFLGAVVYFLAVDADTSNRATKWLAAACVVIGPMVSFGTGNPRFWWLIASGLVLVSVRYIPLPSFLVRIVTVVGAATFGIFLTHIVWIKVVQRFTEELLGPRAKTPSLILFALALLLGTLTWGAVVAFGRAYRAVQSDPARPALAQ